MDGWILVRNVFPQAVFWLELLFVPLSLPSKHQKPTQLFSNRADLWGIISENNVLAVWHLRQITVQSKQTVTTQYSWVGQLSRKWSVDDITSLCLLFLNLLRYILFFIPSGSEHLTQFNIKQNGMIYYCHGLRSLKKVPGNGTTVCSFLQRNVYSVHTIWFISCWDRTTHTLGLFLIIGGVEDGLSSHIWRTSVSFTTVVHCPARFCTSAAWKWGLQASKLKDDGVISSFTLCKRHLLYTDTLKQKTCPLRRNSDKFWSSVRFLNEASGTFTSTDWLLNDFLS